MGIQVIAQNQPVVGVIEGEGFRRESDGFLQTRQLGPGDGDITPEQNRVAVGAAARLDLHHAMVAQCHVARGELVIPQLAQSLGNKGFDAGRQCAGCNLAALDLQADHLFIAAPDQRIARRERAEKIIEMGVGIEQPTCGIENGNGRAQGIQRAEQRCRVFPNVFPAVNIRRTGYGHFLLCA